MDESAPSWTFLNGKVWKIVRKDLGIDDDGIRRILVKHIYRMCKGKIFSEKNLLWSPPSVLVDEVRSEDEEIVFTSLKKHKSTQTEDNHDFDTLHDSDGTSNAGSFFDDDFQRSSTTKDLEVAKSNISVDESKTDAFFNKRFKTKVRSTTVNTENYRFRNEKTTIETFFESTPAKESKGEFDEQRPGVIVKYIYYLNVTKDADGNPISWNQRDKIEIPHIPNSKLHMESLDSSDLENVELVKYKYVTTVEEFERHKNDIDDISKDLNHPYLIQFKEATVFSPSSIRSDEDLSGYLKVSTTSKEDELYDISDKYQKSWSNSLSSGYSSYDGSCSTPYDIVSNELENVSITNQDQKFMKRSITENIVGNISSYQERQRTGKSQGYFVRYRSDVERVTFKANCGVLPYSAVFRLDDEITYLKTFIFVISGLPPKRQKYSPIDEDSRGKKAIKKRKLKTLRHLGFNDGDIVHLDVKETTHTYKK